MLHHQVWLPAASFCRHPWCPGNFYGTLYHPAGHCQGLRQSTHLTPGSSVPDCITHIGCCHLLEVPPFFWQPACLPAPCPPLPHDIPTCIALPRSPSLAISLPLSVTHYALSCALCRSVPRYLHCTPSPLHSLLSIPWQNPRCVLHMPMMSPSHVDSCALLSPLETT